MFYTEEEEEQRECVWYGRLTGRESMAHTRNGRKFRERKCRAKGSWDWARVGVGAGKSRARRGSDGGGVGLTQSSIG